MHAIETHRLTKFYGRTRGIEGMDLEVREGEVFGFIGPNGAGKSTTIRTLLGLVRATSGAGADLRSRSRGSRAGRRGGASATCPPRSATTRACGLRDSRLRGAVLRATAAPVASRSCWTSSSSTPRETRRGPLDGQPQEARHRAGPHPPAVPPHPRRAHDGARPADAGAVLHRRAEGARGRHDDLLLLPRPPGGRADLRPGRGGEGRRGRRGRRDADPPGGPRSSRSG